MKGTIFNIKRFAIHDGPGIRTTVFLKGCSLNCLWCHNPESISPKIEAYISKEKIGDKIFSKKKNVGEQVSVNEVFNEIVKDALFMEESRGGVTLSGGEPLLQAGFASQLLKMCKNAGLHTVIDTAGNVPQKNIEQAVNYTDLFLFDIKFISSEKHKKFTGVDNQLILNNFKYLIKQNKHIIVRIPLIPKANLNNDEIDKIIQFLLNFKGKNFDEIHLLPYHHIGQSKYEKFNINNRMENIDEPDISELIPVKQKFISAGFKIQIK